MKVEDVRTERPSSQEWSAGDTLVDDDGDVWMCIGNGEIVMIGDTRRGSDGVFTAGTIIPRSDLTVDYSRCECVLRVVR